MGGTTRTNEPSRALKAVLDFPFRLELKEGIRARVGALFESVKAIPEDQSWAPAYEEALAICRAAAADLDSRVGQLQRDALALAEEIERANRAAASGQSRPEESRREAHRTAQRVAKDWTERTRRQLEHITYECVATAATTLEREGVHMQPVPGPVPPAFAQDVTITARSDWWHRYVAYAQQSCDRWTQVTTEGVETALREAVVPTLPRGPDASTVELPKPRGGPETDVLLGGRPPPQQVVEIPGMVGMAFTRVRSLGFGVMGVVMLAGVPLSLIIGKEKGTRELGWGGALLFLCLVFTFITIAISQAIALQRKERTKGVTAQRQALEGYVRAEVQRMLERHRGKLERYIQTRTEDWEAAIDAHYAQHVAPGLERNSAEQLESLRDLKLRAVALNEELSKARSQRGTLQNAWVELQSHARDLGVS
ncbi:MAG: hypothetical protein KF718_05315 [Polyangiaceae bacterium]|nr:hypothetical protein [Polyangiaceae bacterium]